MSEDFIFALEQLADASRPVRATNVLALSDMPRSQTEVFRRAWAGLSSNRRLELVCELVEQAEGNIHLNFDAILRELLYDFDPQVRRTAIEGLWEDNRPTLVAPLVNLAGSDPSVEVRAAAAMALGRFVLLGALGEISEGRAVQAEEALRAAWYRPQEVTEVRRRALEGLGYSNQPDVRELISVAYYDEDELLRQSALFAMGRSADRRWSRYVMAELTNPVPAMRFEAAVAAGELGISAAVPVLVQLLDDRDSSVREAAATALGEIGGPAAKRALADAAGGSDEVLAAAAEAALEELNFNSGRLNADLLELDDVQATPDGDFDIEDLNDGDNYDDLYDGDLLDSEEDPDDLYGDADDLGWVNEDDDQEDW
jgi:HEAT repeat protein